MFRKKMPRYLDSNIPLSSEYRYWEEPAAEMEEFQAILNGHQVKIMVPTQMGLMLDKQSGSKELVIEEVRRSKGAGVIDRHDIIVMARKLAKEEANKGFRAKFSTPYLPSKPPEPDPIEYPIELAPTPKHLRGRPIPKVLTAEEKKELLKNKDIFKFKLATREGEERILSSIEFEMGTPKVPDPPPPKTFDTRDSQYDPKDCPLPTPPPSPVIEEVVEVVIPPPAKPKKGGKKGKGKGKKGKGGKGKGKGGKGGKGKGKKGKKGKK